MPLPIQFLLFLLIGWVSRQQAEAIEYLKAENRALREKLGGKRLPSSWCGKDDVPGSGDEC